MENKQKTSFSNSKTSIEPESARCKSVSAQGKTKTPKLRHHKATGQAYAVLNGRAVYFGPYGTEEASQQYHKVIAEWLANGRQPEKATEEITINELVARFWVYAEGYYRDLSGKPTTELGNLKVALRPMCDIYGSSRAVEFGPRALKTVRKRLIDRGLCRNHINKCISRIKMLFKWATAEEILPGSVYHALLTVAGLNKGRDGVRESDPVKPVLQEYVDAIQPYVSRQVWAIVQLQLLTGARSGELVILRPCDMDMTGKIWLYRPVHHKTAHHGFSRTIYFGPRAQEVLRPFLLRPSDAYCFSPAEAMAQWRQENFVNRKTPLHQGNGPGTNVKEKARRQAGEHYTATGYGHTIARAIKKAFRPEGMPDEEFATWKPDQHWHPHQLRHNAATFLRKEFGLETARIILGHRSSAITEVYAEQDQQKALEAIVRVG